MPKRPPTVFSFVLLLKRLYIIHFVKYTIYLHFIVIFYKINIHLIQIACQGDPFKIMILAHIFHTILRYKIPIKKKAAEELGSLLFVYNQTG